ncbi:G5 domain-containing protein [Candidatus Daviesbacteria bacterium]|nr:G5 domain-containing protein [Candidatus Daviesbacteria bacterium]
MDRYWGFFLIAVLLLTARFIWPIFPPPVQASIEEGDHKLPAYQPLETQSRFTDKLEENVEIIPKKTVYEDDPETEAGEEKVLEEGGAGKKVKIIKITYYDNKEYNREVVSIDTTPAKDKKISRGTKIVWKTLSTADGEIKYWKKMRVYATHYDSKCPGCDEWTAIGMRAGKGVIAVDPKVIPMRSKVYIPGYGEAVAGDTGGAIKGNIIDLGFNDARTAGWSARFVDIYLL